MSYFRKLETKLTHLQELFDRAERWLIVINADPDAYAAMLLEQVRLPASDYPVPHFRPVTLPTEAQVQSVIDWFAAKYGLSRSVSYADLVIKE